MIKRIGITIISILLLISFRVYSVSIDSCSSGIGEWECESDGVCSCEIFDCTDGDLLVYQNDITNLLCAPPILDSSSDIFWEECGNPSGHVIIRADCEEGQSSEKTINIIDLGLVPETTTSVPTTTTTIAEYCNYVCLSSCTEDNNPPLCYHRISHGSIGCVSGKICCESILKECPESEPDEPVIIDKTCPYQCCIDMPGYEYKPCASGLKCCDNSCKETCESSPKVKIPRQIALWIILATAIPLVAFIIFSLKREKLADIPEY
ncbi:MAG: hypothetical protein GF368_06125 [Candidatus Aenigmarchaeota archaeon]|nr:hypothetical protein [Candidatus Aenigmarchaeota archaeon]